MKSKYLYQKKVVRLASQYYQTLKKSGESITWAKSLKKAHDLLKKFQTNLIHFVKVSGEESYRVVTDWIGGEYKSDTRMLFTDLGKEAAKVNSTISAYCDRLTFIK